MIANIVFTRGTAELLWVFTKSILEHSNLLVRLVLNGCSNEERIYLQEKCRENRRLEIYLFPGQNISKHWEVLNHIFELDVNEEYFFILDSDIFATGPFMNIFDNFLDSGSFICSCPPIWAESLIVEEDFPFLQGRHFYERNGMMVGGTYLSIYNRKDLEYVMRNFKISFKRYLAENLPNNVLNILIEHGFKYQKYDTGKVLNIFLTLFCTGGKFVENERLIHIGGSSWNKSFIEDKFLSSIRFRNPQNPILRDIVITKKLVAHYFLNIHKGEDTKRTYKKLEERVSHKVLERIKNASYEIAKEYKRNFE